MSPWSLMVQGTIRQRTHAEALLNPLEPEDMDSSPALPAGSEP